jgi:hypothetical protein
VVKPLLSRFDPGLELERRYDVERNMRLFEEANALLASSKGM